MQRLRRRISCSMVGVALLAAGCNRESNAPPPPVMPAATETQELAPAAEAPAPAGESGAAAFSGDAEQPANLAQDVPLYAHALPVSSMTSAGHGTIVNLRSDDAAALISAWYGTELPARGWELEKQSGVAGSHLVIARKGARKATVLITGGPQGSQILLTVLEER
jgi:hypothetical protein